ncbi:hypothetical protein ElyMa_001080400 [Elysia marginata]|uniref:Uncharacterized protein n=1 Tax=Elysia marginata TaxID=1093978 RepID=A0AAV4HSZ6_9GAST|nr:hypothetical protein ElyMa_001080400 [Elysia marginata]
MYPANVISLEKTEVLNERQRKTEEDREAHRGTKKHRGQEEDNPRIAEYCWDLYHWRLGCFNTQRVWVILICILSSVEDPPPTPNTRTFRPCSDLKACTACNNTRRNVTKKRQGF